MIRSSGNNRLNIDLSHWVGRPCTLQAIQRQGLSWRLLGEYPVETFDPLADPGVAFSALGSLPGTADWFSVRFPYSFPRLMQLESLYGGQQWTALWLLERYPVAQDLISRWPLLPWLLLNRTARGEIRIEQLPQILSLKPLAILEHCGLPLDPALLNLLQALPSSDLTRGIAQLIHTDVVLNNVASLVAHEHFDIRLLKGLALFPWLVNSRLLASYRSDWNWAELRFHFNQITVAARQLGLEPAEQLIRDSESLLSLKDLSGRLLRQLPPKTCNLDEQMRIASIILSALDSELTLLSLEHQH